MLTLAIKHVYLTVCRQAAHHRIPPPPSRPPRRGSVGAVCTVPPRTGRIRNGRSTPGRRHQRTRRIGRSTGRGRGIHCIGSRRHAPPPASVSSRRTRSTACRAQELSEPGCVFFEKKNRYDATKLACHITKVNNVTKKCYFGLAYAVARVCELKPASILIKIFEIDNASQK